VFFSRSETTQLSLVRALEKRLPQRLVSRIQRIPTGARLASAAGWSLAGAVGARVLTFPIGVILARLMGRAGYGQLGIIYASVELFATFGGLGLGLASTKHVAELRKKDPVRAGRIIGLSMFLTMVAGGMLALGLLLLAPWIAPRILAEPTLVGPLRISAVLLYLSVIDSVQMASLAGFEAFKVSARIRVLKGTLDLPLMIGGYFLGGLDGVIWGASLSRAIQYVANRLALKSEARRAGMVLSFRHCLQESRVLWSFSLPALISGILVAPVNWVCSAMLVNQARGYIEMGSYSAANQWYSLIIFLPLTMGTGVLPIISERMGDQDSENSRAVLRTVLKLNAVIVIPAVVILSVFSPLLMAIYGHGYRDSWPTLIAVAATAGIFAMCAPVGDVIAASGRMWVGCAMNLGWAAIFIATSVFLVRWGSLGLASSRLIAYCAHAGWTFYFAYKVLQPSSTASEPAGWRRRFALFSAVKSRM
jgi:O-antigen/teichoic acid export membrane protein